LAFVLEAIALSIFVRAAPHLAWRNVCLRVLVCGRKAETA